MKKGRKLGLAKEGGNAMETRIAVMGIIVEDTDITEKLNGILHEYGKYIVGRMGVPYRDRGICIISIIVDAPMDVISSLAGKIGMLKGVSIKTVYQKAGDANAD